MKRLHNFIGHISNYLLGKDSLPERKDLYSWYEDINHQVAYTEEERNRIGMRARDRIVQTIRPVKQVKDIFYWRWIGAAVSILLVGTAIYWYAFRYERMATTAELAVRKPGDEHAMIILPSGEAVNLDSIPLAQSVQVGETMISKNANGEITYHSTVGNVNPVYTLQTPRSSTSEIILSDGTKVLLNAGSKLYYPSRFGDGERIVRLEGEGYFQVTKTTDKTRFIVKSGKQSTEVLGTKFNVKAYPDEDMTWTTLEEGSVRVVSEQQHTLRLVPGQQSVSGQDQLIAQTADLDAVLGWTKGVFYFNGNNTGDVLKEIEQWYDIDISYSGNKTGAQYSGKIPRNLSLDKLIDLLSYADFKVEPRINKQNRINLIIN